MISNLKEIAEAFTIFHGGEIMQSHLENGNWNIKLFIPFLATEIKKEYSYFYISLSDISEWYFTPWQKEKKRFEDCNQLDSFNTVILSADHNTFDFLEIQLDHPEYHPPLYDGGVIFIKCQHLHVYDQEFNRLELKDLKFALRTHLTKRRNNFQ